jgi:pilus assembly protein FimV
MIFAFIAIFFALVSETSAQSSNLQIKGPKDAQSQFSGATYGPIDASDTLWRISSRYRQNQALSVYQVMVAIYELNPQAFEQQNLNLLVDGAVLKLPSERYVERVDASKAKQRAQQDDQSLGSKATALQSSKTPNIKPAEELVNKSDLNDTKNQIEQKISQLDDQQIQQFEFLRQQFAASIDNVEALIDENRKVFERLDSVNQDLVDLRTQVDEEVKPQIDQQLELQQELLALIKNAEARQQLREASSWSQSLTNPMTLIIGSTVLMLLLVGSVIFWLVKRTRTKDPVPAVASTTTTNAPMSTQPQVDDLSDSLVEDLAIPDADDDLFNDDELLDDVLSEELEESLDDVVENELENYADLSDEMLVPDIDDESDSLFEDDDDELLKGLGDVDLDELDGIDLSDDNDIDLADSINDELDEELLSELDTASELEDESLDDLFDDDDLGVDENAQEKALTNDDDIDSMLNAELDEDIAEQIEAPGIDADDKPEISIDELLDDSVESNETPSGIDIDVDTGVSAQMLGQLEEEVATQNAEIDRVSDEILNELEQLEMMQGMVGEDDLVDDDAQQSTPDSATEVQQGIQSLDDFSRGVDELESDDFDDLNDPLSEDLLADLDSADSAGDSLVDADSMANEILSELGVDTDNDVEPLGVDGLIDDSDALAEELLTELGVVEDGDNAQTDGGVDADSSVQGSSAQSDDSVDENGGLTDDLLQAFEVDEEVLAVAGKGTNPNDLSAELDEIPSLGLNDDSDEIDDSLLESALEEAENASTSVPVESEDLDDMPGLDDWLSNEDSEDNVILEEIEGADFDDLLDSIDSDVDVESELKLDNPDLDLDVLFTDPDEKESEATSDSFVDVDTLLEESAADDGSSADETNLNLDVALSEFSGVSADDVVVDVDSGGSQAANLDLAQAYIEMDDKDAAIELLKEVIREGTDEQKEEAERIVGMLG